MGRRRDRKKINDNKVENKLNKNLEKELEEELDEDDDEFDDDELDNESDDEADYETTEESGGLKKKITGLADELIEQLADDDSTLNTVVGEVREELIFKVKITLVILAGVIVAIAVAIFASI